MSRFNGSPGRRLLKFLMDRGGSATLWEISRRSNDGRLYARAKSELDGLIVLEKSGSPKSRRRCTRVFLTMKGWAACAALRPAWTPTRLSTDALKAWLEELQREREPWACQFLKDADDAAELRRLRSMKWIRPPLKKRGPPAGIQPKGGFQRRIDPIPAGEKIIPSKIPSPAQIGRPSPAILPAPRAQQPAQDLSDYHRYVRDAYPSGLPRAKAADVPTLEIERIKERIRKAGYADAIEGEKVRFDNRLISFQEWERENPE
jgi:hypothetical protein